MPLPNRSARHISPGLCIGCEEGIEAARLAAAPGAIRCIDCQREHEAEARLADQIEGVTVIRKGEAGKPQRGIRQLEAEALMVRPRR